MSFDRCVCAPFPNLNTSSDPTPYPPTGVMRRSRVLLYVSQRQPSRCTQFEIDFKYGNFAACWTVVRYGTVASG
eukprot:38369-Hanusia_phi.AAC.1